MLTTFMSLLIRLSSLKFTVVLLLLALMLVFAGTLAQVELGIFRSQQIYFESFFLWRDFFGLSLPMLPAGYSIGSLLILNLCAAFVTRFRMRAKHAGLLCVHAGLIILLLGELFTDVFSVESQLRLAEGESKNFTESIYRYELAIAKSIESGQRVVAYPAQQLKPDALLSHGDMPVTLKVLNFWPNSMLRAKSDSAPTLADSGIGSNVAMLPMPLTGKMDERNVPSALIELSAKGESLGTYLFSGHLGSADIVTLPDGSTVEISLRPERYYMENWIQLNDFVREVYPGTNKPSHFESQLTLSGGHLPTPREVKVYMNHPLRFDGKTFYQASFAGNETVSILQVVQNPTWLMPYLSCALVTAGLAWQSASRLKLQRKEAAA